MIGALTPLVLLAAGLLCVAGVAKLRTPAPAAMALRAAGVSVPPSLVRTWAGVELAVGGVALISGGALAAIALGLFYLAFAGLSVLLARHRAACGCFGAGDAPVTVWHSALGAVLAAGCLGAAGAGWHSLPWLLDLPPAEAVVSLIGMAGCVYAGVIAYTTLPAAWTAWGGR